jgi:hypothetical protein
MYHDLRTTYWWHGMKGDVAEYVALLWHLPRESRQSINDLRDCCNLCKYSSGSGKRLLWISLWGYPRLNMDMIPFE